MSGFASGIFGAIGSAMSIGAQNANTDKMLAFQQRENQFNRDWNLNLAKMQRQWSLDDWYREAAYNSPANQRKMLSDAGMNPDLAYGQNIAAPATNPTTPAPSEPVDGSAIANQRTYGEVIRDALSAALAGAQVKKTEKESEKTGQETKNLVIQGRILTTDDIYRAAQHESVIEMNGSQVFLNKELAKLPEHQISEIAARVTNLTQQTEKAKQDINESLAKISKWQADVVDRRARLALDSKEVNAKIAMMYEQNSREWQALGLRKQEVEAFVKLSVAREMNLNASTYNLDADTQRKLKECGLLDINIQRAAFNLSQDKKFDSIERSVGIAATAVNAIANGVGAVVDVMTAGASRAVTSGLSKSTYSPKPYNRPDFWNQ